MTYSGLELLMENLKQLIYCNDNPLINNQPAILNERPQIQLLYVHISSMIKTMFDENENELDHLEQVRNLKNKFKDVVKEAHNIVGLFVYAINYRSKNPRTRYHFHPSSNYDGLISLIDSNFSLNLENVMRSIMSIKEELVMILNKLKTNSFPSINPQKRKPSAAVAGTSFTRNSIGKKKVLEEIVVGLAHDIGLVRDKLVEDQKQLDVVSIVGMGGLGKTTLATIVFNDRFVLHHFQIRAWVTVSQTYEKRDLLIQILGFIDVQSDLVSASDSRLRELLHKRLMGKRYLIVVDDIWSIEAWNDLKMFFPNNNIGSRILLTSRLNEVALHAKSHGFIHQLSYFTNEESWELLRKKVFGGNDFPNFLIEPGRLIAENCNGLPLAVVVIAGVLAKEAVTKDSWERIAQSVSSYIASDQNGYMDILALSFEHLPPYLKDCFLYLGGFPEDHKFRVSRLMWLWVAEGFIQEAGNRSVEEIAEDYLKELVDRNLVVVTGRRFNGSIKACSVHDLLRELCLKKATQEQFCLKINMPMTSFSIMRPRRIFTNVDFFKNNFCNQPSPRVESLLCFHRGKSLINISTRYFYSYPLLMVLDLQKCRLKVFPQTIELLVHLRYLAFWYIKGFPSCICNLWSLQTLIAKSFMPLVLPNTVSNLVNLRHLKSNTTINIKSFEKPMNLQTISRVAFGNGAATWLNCFPGIKKLKSMTRVGYNHDFKSLTSLETLLWVNVGLSGSEKLVDGQRIYPKIDMRLPATLRKLSLTGCYLPWSDMSIIQSLPNLEVLKLLDHAFLGPRWETGVEQFQQLKFLKLQHLNIQQWEAFSINFPCLKRIVVNRCRDLEEIPIELGDIATLELIEVDDWSSSVVQSLDIIQEEQHDLGNYD